jgi:hypothetical protein
MLRQGASGLSLIAGLVLAGCGADVVVNPTNPDASSAARPPDGGGDGPKGDAGTSRDGARDGETDTSPEAESTGDT